MPERPMPNRWLMAPNIALAGWIGCAYIFGDAVRTSTPSFKIARDIVPLSTWGFLFLAGALAVTAATVACSPHWMGVTLFIGGIIYTWWAALFLITSILDSTASLNSFMLYFFIAFVHFAGAWRFLVRAAI